MKIAKHGKYRASRRVKEVGWCFGGVVPEGGVLLICHREELTVLPTTCYCRSKKFCTGTRCCSEHSEGPSFPPVAGLSAFRKNAW